MDRSDRSERWQDGKVYRKQNIFLLHCFIDCSLIRPYSDGPLRGRHGESADRVLGDLSICSERNRYDRGVVADLRARLRSNGEASCSQIQRRSFLSGSHKCHVPADDAVIGGCDICSLQRIGLSWCTLSSLVRHPGLHRRGGKTFRSALSIQRRKSDL